MFRVRTRNFNLVRILLIIIGVCPYNQSILIRLQFLLLIGTLVSFILFQFTALLKEFNTEVVFRVLSPTTCFMVQVIKYNAFSINMPTVKYLLEQLECICNKLTDENEIAIIIKYGKYAKTFTYLLLLAALWCIFSYICLPFGPFLFHTFLSTNKTQPTITLYITTEYFINEEKYRYFIMLHMDIAGTIGMVAVVATGSAFMTYLAHACALFRIASYRIKQAMVMDASRNSFLKNEMAIYREIIRAVDIQRKGMKICDLLMNDFEISYMVLVATGVLCLSINLYRISRNLLIKEDRMKILLNLMCVGLIILYMFWANFIGQQVTDHNNHIFLTAYNVQWYAAPLRIQRLILFLQQRSNKIFTLNLGNLVVASFECFATLISASISYFTVLYSMQS